MCFFVTGGDRFRKTNDIKYKLYIILFPSFYFDKLFHFVSSTEIMASAWPRREYHIVVISLLHTYLPLLKLAHCSDVMANFRIVICILFTYSKTTRAQFAYIIYTYYVHKVCERALEQWRPFEKSVCDN